MLTALSLDLKLALVSHKGIFELWCLKRKTCLFRSATTSLDLDKDIAKCRGIGFVQEGQSLAVYHQDVNRIWRIFEYDGTVAFKPIYEFRRKGRGGAKACFFGQDIERMLFIVPQGFSQTDYEIGIYNVVSNRGCQGGYEGIVNSGIDSRRKKAVFLQKSASYDNRSYSVLTHDFGTLSFEQKEGEIKLTDAWKGSLSLSSNGRWLFIFDFSQRNLFFWDLSRINKPNFQEGRSITFPRMEEDVEGFLVHPKHRFVVTHSKYKVHIWNIFAM